MYNNNNTTPKGLVANVLYKQKKKEGFFFFRLPSFTAIEEELGRKSKVHEAPGDAVCFGIPGVRVVKPRGGFENGVKKMNRRIRRVKE